MDFIRTSWICVFIILSGGVTGTIGIATKDCNVSVEAEGTTISSPNFPKDYINNAKCWYVIRAPLDYVITLVFSSFAVEKGTGSVCRYDRLLVYDSSTYLDDPLYTLCGYELPPSITSTSNSLTLCFESDGRLTDYGFQARYEFTSPDGVHQQGTTEALADSTETKDMLTSAETIVLATETPAGSTGASDMSTLIGTDLSDFYNKVELRLSGGDAVDRGRVEVLIGNQWGSICGEGWNVSHAHAACKQLGYEYALQATRGIRFGLGSSPVYNIMCNREFDDLSFCSYYKDPDQQCNHWGFAGIVCFVSSSTPDLEKNAVSTIRKLPLLAVLLLFALLILAPGAALIVRKKRQNASTFRLEFLQLQNRQLPIIPNEECINMNKRVPKTVSAPLESPGNTQKSDQTYADPLYETCKTSFITGDDYSRQFCLSNKFVLQSHEVKHIPCDEEHGSKLETTYYELSDQCSSSSDLSAIEHTYSEGAMVKQKDTKVSERSCGEIKHIYNCDDVYDKIA